MSVKAAMPANAPANSPANAPRRRPWWRRWIVRPRVLVPVSLVVAAVLLCQFVLMPRIVRDRVRAVLDAAGLPRATFRVARVTLRATDIRDLRLGPDHHVDHVRVQYAVADLWRGRVDRVILTGARLSADPAKLPMKPRTPATAASNVPPPPPATAPAAGLDLPLNDIELRDCALILADARAVPVRGQVGRSGPWYWFDLHSAAKGDRLSASGKVAQSLRHGSAEMEGSLAGELIDSVVRTYAGAPAAGIDGALTGGVRVSWDAGGVDARGKLEVLARQAGEASAAKLLVSAGVFEGVGHFDAISRPTVTISARGAALATPELSAQGVSGTVTLIDFAPPATAPRQVLAAERLKVGDLEFANGSLEFEVTAPGDVLVRQTRWDWLGGSVAATDVRLAGAGGPVSLTLHARQLELSRLLELFAPEKASGQGKISGDIPVTIDGARIEFGSGQLSALSGGQVQIKDAAAILPSAEAAARARADSPSQAQQIKRDITEALGDFEYDQLSARLENAPAGGGVVARVRMKGRGRTGARQRINYELNVNRIDHLLKSYLGVQEAINASQPPAEAPQASPALQPPAEAPQASPAPHEPPATRAAGKEAS
ncbi:MAG TPA: YdbH domain-containing protein [Tepidisphaeraceae bacterium]|nr:YdbH domain-containing protein [Tepidisphaeraceae bacterium]